MIFEDSFEPVKSANCKSTIFKKKKLPEDAFREFLFYYIRDSFQDNRECIRIWMSGHWPSTARRETEWLKMNCIDDMRLG